MFLSPITGVTKWSFFSLKTTSVAFLCPHVILGVICLIEAYRRSKQVPITLPLLAVGGLPLLYQVVVALTLRANWTIDILLAAAVTFLAATWANKLAPYLDAVKSL